MFKKISIFLMVIVLTVYNMTLYQAKTINDINQEIATAQSEYNSKTQELENKEKTSEQLTNDMKKIGDEIQATENEITSTKNDIEQKEQQVKKLETKDIPVMKKRAVSSLIFAQRSNNSNYMTESLEKVFSNKQNSLNSLDKAKAAEDLTLAASTSVDDLAKALKEVQGDKKNLENQENNLKVKEGTLEAQKKYSEELQKQLQKDMAEIEGEISNSKDILAAQNAKKDLYENAGCGPNEVYGVDCGVDDMDGYTVPAGDFIRPLRHATVTQNYGYNTYYSTGLHSGIDLAAATGTAIYPTAPGKVLYAGPTTDGGGNSVIMLHTVGGKNYISRYCHMNFVSVSTGQTINTSTSVGGLGSTGNVTGPHLHFEMEEGSNYVWNSLQDPRLFVDFPEVGGSW